MAEYRNLLTRHRRWVRGLITQFNQNTVSSDPSAESLRIAWNRRLTRYYMRAATAPNITLLTSIQTRLDQLGFTTQRSQRTYLVGEIPMQHEVLEAVYSRGTGATVPNMDSRVGGGGERPL